jgi:drug/metabolite transporter (DMT)-like permease
VAPPARTILVMARTVQSPPEAPAPTASSASIWAALAVIYVVWGTTYLAIRVTNQTLPPLLAASLRFLIAGALLYAWSVRRGDRVDDRPGPRQWRAAAIVGVLLLFGGNGGVVWAERTIPSGIAALLIALVPLWIALIDGAVLRHRVSPLTATGIAIGFGGAALLLLGGGGTGRVEPFGMLLVVAASLSWASGALYSRTAPLPRRPLVGAGMEMLAGGIALGIAGVLAGELADVHPERFSVASVASLAYLIVFGSFVAFTCFVWLLRVARTSLVATYAYVNPVVAVFLGWLILGEQVTLRTVVAGLVIVAAVALIISAGGTRRGDEQSVGIGRTR